jgi:hypothetical protein
VVVVAVTIANAAAITVSAMAIIASVAPLVAITANVNNKAYKWLI